MTSRAYPMHSGKRNFKTITQRFDNRKAPEAALAPRPDTSPCTSPQQTIFRRGRWLHWQRLLTAVPEHRGGQTGTTRSPPSAQMRRQQS